MFKNLYFFAFISLATFNLFCTENTQQIFITRNDKGKGTTTYTKRIKISKPTIMAIFSGGWNSQFVAVFNGKLIQGQEAEQIFYRLEEEFNNMSYTLFDSTIDNITKTNLPVNHAIYI